MITQAFKGNINPLPYREWAKQQLSHDINQNAKVKCPECKGNGEIEKLYTADDGDERYFDVECGECDGQGTIPAYEVEDIQVLDVYSESNYKNEVIEKIYQLSTHTHTDFFENLCKSKRIFQGLNYD